MGAIPFKQIVFSLVGGLLPDSRSVKNIRVSGLLLIISNLVPIAMHVIGGWDMSHSLLLYWMENLIIGFFAIFKIILAQGSESLVQSGSEAVNRITNLTQKIPMVLFFMVHYTGFCLGHGVFVVMILTYTALGSTGFDHASVFAELIGKSTLYIYPLIFMVASHGYSFVANFLGKNEYHTITSSSAMLAPYKRIMVVHLSIFAAFFGMTLFGNNLGSLVGFTAVKTIIDFLTHMREHSKWGKASVTIRISKDPAVIINETMARIRLAVTIVQAGIIICFILLLGSMFYSPFNRVNTSEQQSTKPVTVGNNRYPMQLTIPPNWHVTDTADRIMIEPTVGNAIVVIDISHETECSRVSDLAVFSNLFAGGEIVHRGYSSEHGFESWQMGGYEIQTGSYNMQEIRRYPDEPLNYCVNITYYDSTPMQKEVIEMNQMGESLKKAE